MVGRAEAQDCHSADLLRQLHSSPMAVAPYIQYLPRNNFAIVTISTRNFMLKSFSWAGRGWTSTAGFVPVIFSYALVVDHLF